MKFDDLADEFMSGDSKSNSGFNFGDLLINYLKMLEEPSIFKNIDNLGEPSNVEIIHEDGYTFEKKTWESENGKFVMVDMVSIDELSQEQSVELKKITILNELKNAELVEDYEKCAELRDMLKEIE